MIIFLGYLASILMGLILGLLGAGGSILTMPILVYCFSMPAFEATTYSLMIVGVTAMIGAIGYYRKNLVDLRSAIIFAIPAGACVILTRTFILKNLPESILGVSKDNILMLAFALLMIFAAFSMLRSKKIVTENVKNQNPNLLKLISGSSLIGLLTGFVGVGGGFLIVPTLIGLFGLDAKKAIGTSLVVIAANSLIGFKSDLILGSDLDWMFLTIFCLLTASGMIAGIRLGRNFDNQQLKKLFTYLVIVIALLIFSQTLQQMLNS
ncbi:MAG: sulfite exporter TauE/SafE family protein [Proteobacteria bacterium]|nr:sulfite exporter TauE/SafE family protein [Pseudomonadota bacterium]